MGQINVKFIENAHSQLADMSNKVSIVVDCSALKALEDEFLEYKNSILKYFDDLKADLQARIAALAALNINPGDLGAVISWINTFISTNILGPYASMLALQADLLAKMAEIQALLSNIQNAIGDKSIELGCEVDNG